MKNIIKIWAMVVAVTVITACSEITFGDDFLGTAPEINETTLDSMFSSRLYAEKVLTQAYTYLPYGLPTGTASSMNKLGLNILESLTDLNSSFRDNASDGPTKLYYNGSLNSSHSSAGNEAYRFGEENDWSAIRYAWFYINNVDRVPDMSDAEKAERKAQAKMILAISYAEMLRYTGGFPYLDHPVEPTEEMVYPRLTFAESVDKIVELIDEALPSLEWIQTDDNDGRMNKAGAYGLKLRVQLFAASPTFNSNTKWHPDADEYSSYGNESSERWRAALTTAEEFIRELESRGYYQLIQPESDTHDARRRAFRQAYYNRDLKLKASKEDGVYKNGGIRTTNGFPINTRVEVKARLTKQVRGGFPAIWQMPIGAPGWPRGGEIDLFEWVQGTPTQIYQTIHTHYVNGPGGSAGETNPNPDMDFDVTVDHIYGVDRTDNELIFYVDGQETWRYENMYLDDEETALQYPFNKFSFDIILNFSLGGTLNGNTTWAGTIHDEDLPGEMWVDWVKVTKL